MLFDQYAVRQADRGQAPRQWAGLKFFNVYGPKRGDTRAGMKSVVAQIWPRVQAGETVTLFRSHNPNYADGGQMRDFVYVDDVCRYHRVPAAIARGLGRVQRRVGTGAVVRGPGQGGHSPPRGKAPSIDYVDTPVSIRDRYQYFTQARMDRIRAAGFLGQSTPLEEGVRRYVPELPVHGRSVPLMRRLTFTQWVGYAGFRRRPS